ncbi:MAG: DUF4465 domain-containing protein [Bacteroidales bacterium]|nr:DUF4465 domain-containing protein [Candidatus Liminaster caballi]
MKHLFFSVILATSLSATAQDLLVADFENLPFASETTVGEDGTNLEGFFQSGPFYFINMSQTVESEWGSYFMMEGFCYSRSKARTYSSATYAVDQFNTLTGSGASQSEGFGVCYGTGTYSLTADASFLPQTCFVTNNAYAFSSITQGDAYARQFLFDDEFVLTITGIRGEEVTGSVEVCLAAQGAAVFQWIPVDLTTLGECDEVQFSLSSTDVIDLSDYGMGISMNTPAYFCIDNFTALPGSGSAIASPVHRLTPSRSVAEIRALDGTLRPSLSPGVNLVRMSDGSVRKVHK